MREFETCVDAYAVKSRLIALTSTAVAGIGIDCPPPGNLCQGTLPGDQICCNAPDPICAQTCDNGEGEECTPFCESSCFPGDAVVELEGGATKAIAEVRLGDRLLVALPDGSLGYEEVYLNTHRDGTSAAPFVELTLASGRALTLSPRHFIPVAAGAGEIWTDGVVRAADEVRAEDRVWSRAADGKMVLDQVVAVRTKVDIGAFNPLTMNGTIVVDGVVASAHSDWFLDGLVSADAQAKVYQAILAPVRVGYRALGPGWMATLTEDAGIVDMVRTSTGPGTGAAWLLLGLALSMGTVGLVMRRRARAG